MVVAVLGLTWQLNNIVEKFRPDIEQLIAQTIKAPVSIGKIEAQLLPSIGIGVLDVKLKSEGGSEPASAKRVEFKTGLLSLLSGKLAISDFTLEGLQATLVRDSSGKISVGGIPLDRQNSAQTSATNPQDPESKKKPISLQVAKAEIVNAQLKWIDNAVAPQQVLEFKDINAKLSDIDSAGRAQINFSASLLGKESSNFKLNGLLGNILANQPLDLTMEIASLDLAAVALLLKAYKIDLKQVSLGQTLTLKIRANSVTGGIGLAVAIDATKSELAFADQFKKSAGETLTVNLNAIVNPLAQEVKAEQVKIQLGKNFIELPLTARPGGDSQLQIKTTDFALGELARFVPALANYQASGSLDMDINAKLSAAPTAKGELSLKGLGLSVKIPEKSANTGAAAKPEAPPVKKPVQVSDLNGRVVIDGEKLQVTQLTGLINGQKIDFTATALLTPAKISVNPSQLKIFDGVVSLEADLEQREQGELRINLNARNLNSSQLLAAVAPGGAVGLAGTLENFTAKLSGDKTNFAQTASGPISLQLGKGRIVGLNIIGSALAKLNQIPGIGAAMSAFIPDSLKGADTAFDQLSLAANMGSNQVQISSFVLTHSHYLLNGAGRVGLNDTMNLKAQAKLTPALTAGMVAKEAKLGLLLDREKNMVFPLVISRENGSTLVLPDAEDLLKRAASNSAKEAAGKALDKVVPGLGEGASKLLDKLF